MPAPANNLFATRTVIGSVPYTLTGIDNTDCIEEASEPLFIAQGDGTVAGASAGFKHLWWEFTPAVTQTYLLQLSSTSPTFGIFTGSALGALTEVASWSDLLHITLTAGVSYQICVISWNGVASPTFDLSLTLTADVPGQQLQTAREITSWPLNEEIDGSLLTEHGPVSNNQRVVAYKMTFTEETYLSFWIHKGTGATTIAPYVGVFSEANWNIFDWPDNWPDLFNYVGVNYPVIVAFVPGTYYFYATYFNATPLAQNVAIDVQKWTQPAEIPSGALIISDDRGVLPSAVLDTATWDFLGFMPGVPAGEAAFTDDASGSTLMENTFGADFYPYEDPPGFVLFGPDWTKTWALTQASSPSVITGNGAGKFYVGNITPHPSTSTRYIKGINVSTPALDGTSWVVDVPSLYDLFGLAVSPDESTFYYSAADSGIAEKKVRRWDVGSNTALSDLATSATHEPVREILAMADGSILVSWYKTDFTAFVRRYDPSGSVLGTVDLFDAHSPEMRMWHDTDPDHFWIWIKKEPNVSVFRKIRASDMTVIVTSPDIPWFVSGLLGSHESVAPAARFGHSFSCSGTITRAALFPGAGGSASPSEGPEDEDGTIGPLVWVEWPRRVPALEVS